MIQQRKKELLMQDCGHHSQLIDNEIEALALHEFTSASASSCSSTILFFSPSCSIASVADCEDELELELELAIERVVIIC